MNELAPGPPIATVDTAGDAELAKVRPVDGLALCLSAFVSLTHRATSLDMMLAGLPLKNGLLTPDLLRRALDQLGYKTRLQKRSLGKLLPIHCPAILFMGDDDAVIAKSRKGNTFRIMDPQTGAESDLALKDLQSSYAGVTLLARKTEAVGSENRSLMRNAEGHWFWSAVRHISGTYGYVILAATVINMVALAIPLFTMNVYDRVLPNKAIGTLWVLVSGVGVALVFDYFLKSLRSRLIETAGRRADVILASRIFSHVLSIRMDQRPPTTGSFASHLKEFESVREFFTSSTIASFTDMAFFVLFLLVIYMVGGPLAIIPLLAAIIVIGLGLYYQIPLRRAADQHSKETAQRHSLLVETISSLETVKSVRAESHLLGIWEGLTGLTSRTVERIRHINSSLAQQTSFIQQAVSVLIVAMGTHLFSEGKVSMGAIIASVMLAGKAVAPLGQFAMVLARSQQSLTSLASLNTIMSMQNEMKGEKHFISKPIDDTTIQLQNLTFGYPGTSNPVFAGLNLHIRPGEKVGIIGKIGSGKTTIGRLLNKLYEPTEGAVVIGGVDIKQYHPHEVRRVVGLLSQDIELFHGTLRSNILMAAPRATDAQLMEACRLAGVEDFVRRHPSGLELQVGERGQALSGGQRQAVALARLFVAEPKVIFLDEPSSAMDLASERMLIEQLRKALKPDQTVIVSTHRYSMLELVDRLIVINNGKIAADGPKDGVLEALRKQSGGAQAQPKAPTAADKQQ
jgi:ATP-binding cassette, subfamily C, bacterial LapB